MVLFVLLSPLLALQSYLTKNLMELVFNFELIIEVFITPPSKTGTHSYFLVNFLID